MSAASDIVFTGLGFCCTLGDDLGAVTHQLKNGVGQSFSPWPPAIEYGGRCRIVGPCDTDVSNRALGISAAQGRFMGNSARFALHAARQAVAQAKCETKDLAVLVGSGTGDCDTVDEVRAKLEKSGMRKASPAAVPKLMASTVSANLATVFGASGPSCSLTAACATGPYNLVMAAMLLRAGAAKIAIAGGADCIQLHFFAGFDSMRALNADDNDRPNVASRPYAADRAGFIMSEGAGVMVMETRASAVARGAEILGVLRGFGMSSDGTGQMVAPSPDGGLRAMRAALEQANKQPSDVGYVNTHGTSTPVGDISEVRAIRELFDGQHVPYSSIKGYTGHAVSASGAIEAIFTLEMLRGGWIAPCINIGDLDPELADYKPVMQPSECGATLALSNSFGFGGTNVSLLLERP